MRALAALGITAALFTIFAARADTNYRYPGGPLQAFACSPVPVAEGTVCYSGDFYGQTLNDRPVQANVRAELVATAEGTSSGKTERIARITITKLSDPTNTYNPDGSLAVQVRANICSYHRTCDWRAESAALTVTRAYGQRFFERSASLEFRLNGYSGAEQTEILASIDIWLPQQQYPIHVSFSPGY